MSRHGYIDDCDDELALGRWRGMVASAIRGKRGQKLLREMLDALDAMPEKRLISESLECDGAVCALGAVGKLRGLDMAGVDPEDAERVAKLFNIAEPLAREITYENDEWTQDEESRWEYMRKWVEKLIVKPEGSE